MREPLAEPALHAARRHQYQLLGERVGQRVGQHGAETVGKKIGPFGTVKMEGHCGATIDRDTDKCGCFWPMASSPRALQLTE